MSNGTSTSAIRLQVARLSIWRRASADRRLLSAMLTVGVWTAVIKLAMVGRDLVIASTFGTSDAIDAFFTALAVPTFAIGMVANIVPAVLVPSYVRIRDLDGQAAASRFVSTVLTGTAASIALLTLILIAAAPVVLPLVGASFAPAKLELTLQLFRLTVPALILSSLATIMAALHNADGRFLMPALVPGITPLVTVAFLSGFGTRWGAYTLAAGLLFGYLLELIVLVLRAHHRGLLQAPSWRASRSELRPFLAQLAPMTLGVAVMSMSPLVQQAMAARLGPGAVAELAYGGKVVTAALGVAATAMATAMFPHFSSLVTAQDWSGVRSTLTRYTRATLLVAIPATLALSLFSVPLVRVLFERGAFTAADTSAVGAVQALYAIQIPFYIIGILGVRLVSAMGGFRMIMCLSVANFVTNIVGMLFFMRLWGVAGIALATSVMYVLAAAAVYVYLFRRLRQLTATP